MKTNHFTLNLQNHLTRQPASLSIQENCEGKIYIECEGVCPVILIKDAGLPGLIGPDLQFDTESLCKKEREDAILADNLLKL